jgi:3-dehydroquinate synthetase
MRLFVKTRDKTYPIYFGTNNCFKIKKILVQNNINPKKLIVIYDKNVPKKIISKFKNKLKNNENIFLGLNFSEKVKNLNTVKKILNVLGKNNFNRND